MQEATDALSAMSISEYKRVPLTHVSPANVGDKVELFGWVASCVVRTHVSFVILSSYPHRVKLVLDKPRNIPFTTSLVVRGVVAAVEKPRDKFTVEVHVASYSFYNGKPAPSFPINKESDKATWSKYAHLALRTPERTLFLVARSQLLAAYRGFYARHGYVEVTPPTFGQVQVEGGATLFKLDYYGKPAFLTQSSQLYLETVAPAVGACYCIMPSYRAELSHTSRHLSEFTHVEGELADIRFSQLMDAIEALLRHVVAEFHEKIVPRVREMRPEFAPLALEQAPFRRLRYADAIEFLRQAGHRKLDGAEYAFGDDIADYSERFLVEEFGKSQPVFLTEFPVEQKPFYMARTADGRFTESCDLLWPGIGEVAGGSMRCDSEEELEAGFAREKIDAAPYGWYLDMARYGPSPHGGYGIGFERIMASLMQYENVDEAIMYPRKCNRCAP